MRIKSQYSATPHNDSNGVTMLVKCMSKLEIAEQAGSAESNTTTIHRKDESCLKDIRM